MSKHTCNCSCDEYTSSNSSSSKSSCDNAKIDFSIQNNYSKCNCKDCRKQRKEKKQETCKRCSSCKKCKCEAEPEKKQYQMSKVEPVYCSNPCQKIVKTCDKVYEIKEGCSTITKEKDNKNIEKCIVITIH